MTSAPPAIPLITAIQPVYAAHDLHDHDPVVRLGGRVEAVDGLGADRHSRVEPERVVGGGEVVVDRLRNPNDGKLVFAQRAPARRRACLRRRPRRARRGAGRRSTSRHRRRRPRRGTDSSSSCRGSSRRGGGCRKPRAARARRAVPSISPCQPSRTPTTSLSRPPPAHDAGSRR